MNRILLIIVLFISNYLPALSQEVCINLLQYTGADKYTTINDNASAFNVFKTHCAGSKGRSTFSNSIGLDAVIKVIPLKFNAGGSSDIERLDNFCKLYQSKFENFSKEIGIITAPVRESLRAFNDCIGMTAKGIYVNPTLGTKQISIDIRRGSDDAAIKGLTYDDKLMECRLPPSVSNDGKTHESIVANKDSVLVLDGNYVTITCVRKPQGEKSGEQFYPAAELIVGTSRGGFSLPIPADVEIPVNRASEIVKMSEALAERVEKLEEFTTKLEPIQLYQCPLDNTHDRRGGAWATWGCVGQISSQKQCYNYTAVGKGDQSTWYKYIDCTPIKSFRLKE